MRIKILKYVLSKKDSSASASIVRKDELHKRYQILKDKKNKWSIMEGTFNTSLINRNNIKTLRIKSFRGNLREMPFDEQIIKLRFNPR